MTDETMGSTGMNERLSVIICSKDRRRDLERAVESVRQSGPMAVSAELVVVEEGDRSEPLSGVQYVHLPRHHRGFGYARNVAIKAATGSLLLFLDDDCEAAAGWAEALVAPFQRSPDILGVAGAVAVKNCGLVGYAEHILGFPGGGLRYVHEAQGRIAPTTYLSTCNCAYRRIALEQIGGFPEEARAGSEDALVAERLSHLGTCLYNPHAIVYHRTRDRLGAVLRWFMRRGFSEMASLSHRRDRRSYRWYLLRSSWTIRVVLLMVLVIGFPPLLMLAPFGMVLYYAAMLRRFRFARLYPTHRSAWWLVPLVKLTMDTGHELGRWKFILAGGRT